MATKSYYEILGVAQDATEQEIRQAYRRAMQDFHPDMNSGSPKTHSRTRQLNAAKDTLLDPAKRQKYDAKLEKRRARAEPTGTEKQTDDSWDARGFDVNAARRTSQKRRTSIHPLFHIIMIPLGGIAGVSVAILLLWVGFGIDPFNLFSSGKDLVAQTSPDDGPAADNSPLDKPPKGAAEQGEAASQTTPATNTPAKNGPGQPDSPQPPTEPITENPDASLTKNALSETADSSLTNNAAGTPKKIPDNAIEFNGNKYAIFTSSVEWDIANVYSRSVGGKLAEIETHAEQNFCRQLAQGHYAVWIGGSDEEKEGEWIFPDGRKMTYFNWDNGNPSNSGGTECHIQMYPKNGLWNDTWDHEKYPFIVEWDNLPKKEPVVSKNNPSNLRGATPPPPAIAPFDAEEAKVHQKNWADHFGVAVETKNSIGMKLKFLPAGKFVMGEDAEAHGVTLTKPFYMGMHEVTQDEYKRMMGGTRSKWKGSQNPVEEVSWNDAVEFCRKLSALPEEVAAGRVYSLPTEAEWEYACRAGTTTNYSFGDDEGQLARYAWYQMHPDSGTRPVGQKLANPWGLHDMHGNVWEWCHDWHGEYLDGSKDPTGPLEGKARIRRGGNWRGSTERCRSSTRYWGSPFDYNSYGGIRVVVTTPEFSSEYNIPAAGPQSTPPNGLKKGLIAYYPFNGNAKDLGEKGHHAVISGAKSTVNRFGKIGAALEFDGSAHVECPFSVTPYNVCTLSAWVFVANKNPSYGAVASQPRGTLQKTGSGLALCNNGKGQWELEFFADDRGDYMFADIRESGWEHLVGTVSGDSMAFYVNGVVRESKDIKVRIDGASTPVLIGKKFQRDSGLEEGFFVGKVDDVRIYDRALSAAEVKALYEYESTPPAKTATPPKEPVAQPGALPPPAIAPFDAEEAKVHQENWADHFGVAVETENSIGMKLKLIPPGEFVMGEATEAHGVALTKPLYMGIYEVTQEKYERVMGGNPSKWKGSQNPVEEVSWNDAAEFCRKLSALPEEVAAGRAYRLPTEAEWEYACRAGTTTKYSFGDDESQLAMYSWYRTQSDSRAHPVGQKLPNPWGLHDMHGNLHEWCHDWHGEHDDGRKDPTGPLQGTLKVRRGGNWGDEPEDLSSVRKTSAKAPSFHTSYGGFRVVITVEDDLLELVQTNEDQGIGKDNLSKKETSNAIKLSNSIGMKLRKIPAGKFNMGSEMGEDDEEPVHQVTLSDDFYIGVYEVTQEQYMKVMGANPSHFKAAFHPAERMTWNDAVKFCDLLSELPQEKQAGRVYRLPTEAEWEYACRAGSQKEFSFGNDLKQILRCCWFKDNSDGTTHPVGKGRPNRFGLYDMHGNVAEWCADWYGIYSADTVTNPIGAATGSEKIARGGNWESAAEFCRSANRAAHGSGHRDDNHGFRVVMTIQDE